MSSSTLILIEMILILGVVIGIAVNELVSLRRAKRRDEEAASAGASAEGAGHPER